jgi:hypothetical protein
VRSTKPEYRYTPAADGRKTRTTVLTEVTIPNITLEMAKAATFIKGGRYSRRPDARISGLL